MSGIQCRPQLALVVMVLGVVHRRVTPTATLSLCLTGSHQPVEVKLVSVPFPVDFGHYVLIVIIPVNKNRGRFYLSEQLKVHTDTAVNGAGTG